MDNTRDDHIFLEGIVLQTAKDKFKVQLEGGNVIFASIAGKLRLNKIRILINDRVSVAVSKYDLTRGIIKKRL